VHRSTNELEYRRACLRYTNDLKNRQWFNAATPAMRDELILVAQRDGKVL
jgi:hypothetical protein